MITREQCIPLILEVIPEFTPKWNMYLEYWKEAEDYNRPGLCLELAEFQNFIDPYLKEKPQDKVLLERAFSLIEKFMIEGEEEVSTCAATCFLENLLNSVSHDDQSAASFVDFLGPESLAYCQENDKFWGTKTSGLYKDS